MVLKDYILHEITEYNSDYFFLPHLKLIDSSV